MCPCCVPEACNQEIRERKTITDHGLMIRPGLLVEFIMRDNTEGRFSKAIQQWFTLCYRQLFHSSASWHKIPHLGQHLNPETDFKMLSLVTMNSMQVTYTQQSVESNVSDRDVVRSQESMEVCRGHFGGSEVKPRLSFPTWG